MEVERLIILDTETTGTQPLAGDRIVEIACIEVLDRKASGKTFQAYYNPQRAMPEVARRIHGLDDDFLSDKPLFRQDAKELWAFLEGAQLVAHNAGFDISFLNMEFALLDEGYPAIETVFSVLDTLELARSTVSGSRYSLDALCDWFKVDRSGREFHGALLDSELLLEVYLHLTGGQSDLILDSASNASANAAENQSAAMQLTPVETGWLPMDKVFVRAPITDDMRKAHQSYWDS